MPIPFRTCQVSDEVRRLVGDTQECLENATYTWNHFWMCQRHAIEYNIRFEPAVDYRPSIEPVAEPAPAPAPVLIAPEHAGNITDVPCSNCGRNIHNCRMHRGDGCRREDEHDVFCQLCSDCVADLNHRHCSYRGCIVNDGTLCELCESCINCRPMGYSSSTICRSCELEQEADEAEADRESSVIHQYHDYSLPKARPSMTDGLHKGKPFLWLGVELEVEMKSGDKQGAASAIHDTFGEGSSDSYVVLAEDCSLSDGFEMITGPMSLSQHQELWVKLAPFAVKQGCRSFDYSTTGMHVHASRNFFSQLEIGKMLVFLNSAKTRDKIVNLAGRTSEQYARLYPKKFGDALSERHARYEGLNLTNDATIEFRIFKGTLKPGHILANLEFVHALGMYVKNASVRVMEDWPLFWQYVSKNRSEYRHLLEFFNLEAEVAA